jgi:CBS domain-containing membrane protein
VRDLFSKWVGGFIGIGLVSLFAIEFPDYGLIIVGSYGATAVLLYGAPSAPFSQPRNLFGGHLLSALVGVATVTFGPDVIVFQSAFAVATAILLMQLTRTTHPPGGATALIAVIGGDPIRSLEWVYVLAVMAGIAIMFAVAFVSGEQSL